LTTPYRSTPSWHVAASAGRRARLEELEELDQGAPVFRREVPAELVAPVALSRKAGVVEDRSGKGDMSIGEAFPVEAQSKPDEIERVPPDKEPVRPCLRVQQRLDRRNRPVVQIRCRRPKPTERRSGVETCRIGEMVPA
jgi:hypothetical protein